MVISWIIFFVFSLRMPRALAAFLVGAGLSLSGMIIQALIKNPLSSPSILGVNEAAFVGVLVFLTLFFDNMRFTLSISMHYMPLFALAGGFLLLLLLYLLALKQVSSPFKIILIGLGLGSIFQGLNYILVIYGPLMFKAQIHNWINGTVNGVTKDEIIVLGIYLSVALIAVLVNKNRFNMSHFSDEHMMNLGINLKWHKLFFLSVAVMIASACVAVAGSISFIGLIAPHIAKRLVKHHFAVLTPMALLLGGLLGLLADLMGRLLFQPLDLPMGIFVAALGAPFFIFLLIKSKA